MIDEFGNTEEQREAHRRKYEDMWAEGGLALVLKYPDMEAGDWEMLNEWGLESYLTDVHLVERLKTAPQHLRRGINAPTTIGAILTGYVERYLEEASR